MKGSEQFSLARAFGYALMLYWFVPIAAVAEDLAFRNQELEVTIRRQDGSYALRLVGAREPTLLRSIVAAQIDNHWVKSSQYPLHEISQSSFEDRLGRGRQVTVISTGLPAYPDLVYVLKLYDENRYGDITFEVRNQTGKTVTVQSLRSVQSVGARALNLGGADGADRVLPETFSVDTTTQRIYDLEQTPRGTHRATWNQLVYNQQSKRSLFIGALTAKRFATILRLQTTGARGAARIADLTVDSAGTTEVLLTAETSNLRVMPQKNRIELDSPVPPGESLASERLMFSAGFDYHAQLETYGAAMRKLLLPPTPTDCEFGWFSAKTYDKDITAGYITTNAQWLARHLRSAGFDCIHIEPGYAYTTGEFSTPNKTQFPQGVRRVNQEIARLGLKVGGFAEPLNVSTDSWVYKTHKEWLVHNADGEPIRLVNKSPQGGYFVLDVTHPGAQEYVLRTYRTLGREWGWHTLDIDGMDSCSIEGYRYRPNTSALEALRIALKLIREAAGPDVILIGDGIPFLAAAGLVEYEHISQDTAHMFSSTKETAQGVAGHYYTHRNFWMNHPDAFSVQEHPVPRLDAPKDEIALPLTLDEARASIVLAAVSGGKYDIGDDLPTLGAEPERLSLVTNSNLLQMARLGRASKPLDLMTYLPEDEQPSVFFLRQDQRQSMLAVFNWTEQPRSRAFSLSDLQLASGHLYKLYDALDGDLPMPMEADTVRLVDQRARSVRLIKIIDTSIPASAPIIEAHVPIVAKVREDVGFSSSPADTGVPVLGYLWNFGDGTVAYGPSVTHTYTKAGTYVATLTAEGVDGLAAEKAFSITVDGLQIIGPPQRYEEPNN